MKNSVVLVAGLAAGIPVVLLVSIYVVYCCCRRKSQGERLKPQEPRLWRRHSRHRSSHDLFIPSYIPRCVQKFVQHSPARNDSRTSSSQPSPTEDKSFFGSEDSGSYRTANDDVGPQPEKAALSGSFENLHLPGGRLSSLLQISTSSGDSSESIYESRKAGGSRRSPKYVPQDGKSFEFVRPIPVKPLITITRAESLQRDDMQPAAERGAASSRTDDHAGRTRSGSQSRQTKKPPHKVSKSLDNVAVPPSTAAERRGSSDRNLAGRRRSSSERSPGAVAKIPVNIPSKVIHSGKDSKMRGADSLNLGKLHISLQYKQATCDLFVKIIQARDLPAKNLRRNTSSPFVRAYALPSRRHNHRTNVVENDLNPSFNELFIISGLTLMEVRQLTLQFLVIHHELVSRNVVIGDVLLPLAHVELSGQEVNTWRSLQLYNFQNVLGELHVSICHQPLSAKLSVTVVQARNLPKISSLNIGDPYVKVELFSSRRRLAKKKTRVKKKTVSPKFAQTFTFDLGGDAALDQMTLTFTVMVQDSSGCHERIGQVVFSISSEGAEFDHWSHVIANPHCPIEYWHMIHE